MADFDIGRKIKALRLERKLTLQKLAKETGFSPALISQIENDNVSPPIGTLTKLAKVLKVRMGHFFDEGDTDAKYEIVRKKERRKVRRVISKLGTKQGYFYEALSFKKKDKRMEPFLLTIKTDVLDEKSLYSHEGEEFLMVLKGSAELVYDTERLVLKEGDSIYFDSTARHRLLCNNNIPAKVLVVLTK